MTVGFSYGTGAEALIFVAGASGKYPKKFGLPAEKPKSRLCIPRKSREIGVWVSGAEMQASAVDTRTAVWVSTAEKMCKNVLGETRNLSRLFRGSQHQLCIKTRPLLGPSSTSGRSDFFRHFRTFRHLQTIQFGYGMAGAMELGL